MTIAQADIVPPLLAVFGDYNGLMRACRARRIALGISQLELDERAGWAPGYASKIEAGIDKQHRAYQRSIGKESLPLLLEALGLDMAVVARPLGPTKRPKSSFKGKGLLDTREEKMHVARSKGGDTRWRNQTPAQRARHINKMNRARVEKMRAARIKAGRRKVSS